MKTDQTKFKGVRGLAMVVASAGLIALGGCSTWDSMSRTDKGTLGGAAAGAAVGNVVTGGGVLGTVGGAAVGGVVGREAAKR